MARGKITTDHDEMRSARGRSRAGAGAGRRR